MKPKLYIAHLSGGKDSTAMLLRLLEEKRPLDLIIYCDTGLEFPQLYEHLNKLEEYIQTPVIRLRAEKSFEYYFYEYTPKRRNPKLNKYYGMSWPGPRNRWCTAMLKTRVASRYLARLKKEYEIIEYIGIAADEPRRLRDACYPLAEWGITEKDGLDYCYSKGFDWGGLDQIFRRVSCWCCPLQGLDELRRLHEYFPHLWNKLTMLDRNSWRRFRADYSVPQLAMRFDYEKRRIENGQSIRSREFYRELKAILNSSFSEDGKRYAFRSLSYMPEVSDGSYQNQKDMQEYKDAGQIGQKQRKNSI